MSLARADDRRNPAPNELVRLSLVNEADYPHQGQLDFLDNQRATLLRAVQVDESTQARRLAQQQYQEGYIDLIALLEAERSVFQARRAQLAAELRVFRGVVAIYNALGGGVSG